jgi:hypothetical protein
MLALSFRSGIYLLTRGMAMYCGEAVADRGTATLKAEQAERKARSPMRTQIYAGEALDRYGFPGGHPFSNKRFGAFYEEFLKRDLPKRSTVIAPANGDRDILGYFHKNTCIEPVKKSNPYQVSILAQLMKSATRRSRRPLKLAITA